MKIAIASLGKEEDSKISDQAARAPYFLIFDEKGDFVEALENVHADKARNAGGSAARFLAQRGVNLFIAGNVGDRMTRILETEGIKYQAKTGNAKEVAQNIK